MNGSPISAASPAKVAARLCGDLVHPCWCALLAHVAPASPGSTASSLARAAGFACRQLTPGYGVGRRRLPPSGHHSNSITVSPQSA
jgi:hypothetical protein